MNKKSNERKTIWQWLQALIHILQMLAWWNTNKNKRDSRLNTDRVDRMDPVLDSTANKDRMDPATTDTCKTSPPREGSGEAATLIAQPASVTSGPVSSTQSSRLQPSSSPASDSRVSVTPTDYGPEDILSVSPLKGGREDPDRRGPDRVALLSKLRSDCQALTANQSEDVMSGRTWPLNQAPPKSAATPVTPLNRGAGGVLSRGLGLNLIVLHCTDTRPSQQFTIEKLTACHKARGFGDMPGYHLYVRRDGSLYYCRPVSIPGCHVKGYNAHSIGVCYEGGHSDSPEYKYEDNRTAEQLVVLDEVLRTLLSCFPHARLVGHNELAPKACPCFDVQKEYGYLMRNEE